MTAEIRIYLDDMFARNKNDYMYKEFYIPARHSKYRKLLKIR